MCCDKNFIRLNKVKNLSKSLFEEIKINLQGMGADAKKNLSDMLISSPQRDELLNNAFKNYYYTHPETKEVTVNPWINLMTPFLTDKQMQEYSQLFGWEQQKQSHKSRSSNISIQNRILGRN